MSEEPQTQPPIRALLPVVFVFLALLGVMWWAFDGMLQRRANPNRDLAVTSAATGPVILQAGPGGHYRVPGSVNGKRLRFLVDTGASIIAIPALLAHELDVRRGPRIEVETAAGRANAYLTRLDTVVVGSIVQHNVRAAIVPRMRDDYALLGMSFLRHVDMSQQGSELVLKQSP